MTRFLFIAATLLSSASFAQIIHLDTTYTVNASNFQIITGEDSTKVFAHLIKNNLDTITVIGAAGDLDLIDFNSDGYPDIVFGYLGNVLVYDLYMFNSKTNSYEEVDGFNNVSDSKPVPEHDGMYYSYRRAGCADANWTSYLFEIHDFEVRELGQIIGKNCELDEKGITVFKIVTLDKIFEVDRLPIDTVENYSADKWGFIADYWKVNAKKF